MWTSIKHALAGVLQKITDFLTGQTDGNVGARIESRTASARGAVADKHEKEGRRDLMLGERTRDEDLMQTGRERIEVAERLRSDEMSLLEALNLGDGLDGAGVGETQPREGGERGA